jgi:HEAT repeat protein
MDAAALAKLYDASSERQVRSTIIELLSARKDGAGVDKLIDIAKNGTDPGMRRSAISALARSKDPRAQKLLLDLVDHE